MTGSSKMVQSALQGSRFVPILDLEAAGAEKVFAFLDENVSPRGREHWQWKYRLGKSPLTTAFYWQEPDGCVLGFIGLMRTTLYSQEQEHRAAWFVDWHVVPGQKAVGVGIALLRKAEADAGTLLTLQGSADTRKILPRLGWKRSLGPATWVRPLSPHFLADWLARRAPSWLGGMAGLAGAAAGRYFRCRQPEPIAGLALVDVDRFPADYEAVWHERRAELSPAMARDSDYLNYLCADYPGGGYHLQLLDQRGHSLGHLLWRVDEDRHGLSRGRIVDALWPASQPELASWLLRSACWQLQQEGVDYVECVLSVPALRSAAAACRFRPRSPVAIWYHRLPMDVPDPDRWHITFLDCDRAYR